MKLRLKNMMNYPDMKRERKIRKNKRFLMKSITQIKKPKIKKKIEKREDGEKTKNIKIPKQQPII